MDEEIQRRVIEIIIEAKNQATEGVAGAAAEMESLNATALKVGQGMTMAGGAMLGVGAGLAAGVGVLVKQASDYQTMLQNVQNNTTMTTADVQMMHDGLLKMSADTGQGLDQLGQGFMRIDNLTGNAAASMQILAVANESAVSTGGNVEATANTLANIMHEYGADVSNAATQQQRMAEVQANAAHYMGVMHLAAAEANMTLEQFSESSGPVMAWAANIGVPVEQASAAFATLTKHGFSSAEAATQVYNAFEHLIKPSRAAAAEIDRVSKASGVNLAADFSAAGLHAKGLTGVLGDLRDAYAKMGYSQDQITESIMKMVPNIRGGTAMFTLLGTGASDYASILGDLQDKTKTDDVTAQAYARTQETLGYQLSIARQQVQVMAITLGEALLPSINQILKAVLPLITQFAAWAKTHSDLIAKVLLGATAFFLLGGAILTIAGLVTMIIAVLNPVGLTIAGIVLAVTLLGAAWATNFMGIRDTTTRVIGAVRGAIADAISFVERLVPAMGRVGPGFLALSGPIGMAVLAVQHWNEISQAASALVARVWPQVQTVVSTAMRAVQTVVESVLGAVAPFVQAEVGQVVSWFQANFPKMQEAAERVMNAIQTVVSVVWPRIQAMIQGYLTTIVDLVKIELDFLVTLWNDEKDKLLAIVNDLWDAIKVIIDTDLKTIEDIIVIALDIINGDWSDAWAKLKDIVQLQIGAIKQLVPDFVDVGKQLVAGLAVGIQDGAAAVIQAATKVASDSVAAAKATLGIHSPSVVFQQIGQYATQGLSLGLEQGREQVSTAGAALAGSTIPSSGSLQPFVGASAGGGSQTVNIYVQDGAVRVEGAEGSGYEDAGNGIAEVIRQFVLAQKRAPIGSPKLQPGNP